MPRPQYSPLASLLLAALLVMTSSCSTLGEMGDWKYVNSTASVPDDGLATDPGPCPPDNPCAVPLPPPPPPAASAGPPDVPRPTTRGFSLGRRGTRTAGSTAPRTAQPAAARPAARRPVDTAIPGEILGAGADHPRIDPADQVEEAGAAPGQTQPATSTRPIRGLGAFIDPGDMEVENWHALRFLAGPDRETIATESQGSALAGVHVVFIAPTMRVTLPADDPNFQIMRQSPEVRDTGLDRTASWQWKVKPISAGRHTLYATVEILERGPDGRLVNGPDGQPKVIDDYTRKVDIRVRVGTWRGFLNALQSAVNLGDLLGTLFRSWEKSLVALAALIGAVGTVWAAIRKLSPKRRATPRRPRRRPRLRRTAGTAD